MKFCGELLFQDEENDEDNASVNSVDSELTFDFEAFCKSLDDEVEAEMTYEEKVSMVTVNDKYSGGSVEVARGTRMTLARPKGKSEMRKKTIMKEVKRRQTKLAIRRATNDAHEAQQRKSRSSFFSGHSDSQMSDVVVIGANTAGQ